MEQQAAGTGADLFLTGDIGHHEGLDAMELGLTVIDAGHHGLEKDFCRFLWDNFSKKNVPVCEIILSHTKCPFDVK